MRTPNSAADYDGMIVALDQAEPMKRFSYEVIFSAIQKTLSDLLGSAVPNIKVSFPFPAPDDLTPFTRIFGEQIFFDTAQAEFSLPRDITRLTLPSSNRTLRELYESECARLLASLSDSASLTEQTLALIDKLEGQYPQLEQVASMLNMSTRTFRRRLKSEAASFQSLLNDVRVKHARRYLQDTNLSVETIAVSLGFNDASNFRRAFIQWTGQSPAEWRRLSRGDNPADL
jgi:AraC-like DNA-binding protein